MSLEDPKLLRNKAYVDGAWIAADSGDSFRVTDPADDTLVGTVPEMGAAETRRAILAAEAAFPAWSGRPAKERTRILRRWMVLISLGTGS